MFHRRVVVSKLNKIAAGRAEEFQLGDSAARLGIEEQDRFHIDMHLDLVTVAEFLHAGNGEKEVHATQVYAHRGVHTERLHVIYRARQMEFSRIGADHTHMLGPDANFNFADAGWQAVLHVIR